MKTVELPIKPALETAGHLWFRRGGLAFSLPMGEVLELRSFAKIRPLPLAEDGLAGFVPFRDAILPVFDPLVLAGHEAAPVSQPPLAAVALMAGVPRLAILVDRVGRILDLHRCQKLPLGLLDGSDSQAFSERRFEAGVGEILVLNVEGLANQMSLA